VGANEVEIDTHPVIPTRPRFPLPPCTDVDVDVARERLPFEIEIQSPTQTDFCPSLFLALFVGV
jgi:hypothetical protein